MPSNNHTTILIIQLNGSKAISTVWMTLSSTRKNNKCSKVNCAAGVSLKWPDNFFMDAQNETRNKRKSHLLVLLRCTKTQLHTLPSCTLYPNNCYLAELFPKTILARDYWMNQPPNISLFSPLILIFTGLPSFDCSQGPSKWLVCVIIIIDLSCFLNFLVFLNIQQPLHMPTLNHGGQG